jgi:cysteine desulfurase/selenocysteine lyase
MSAKDELKRPRPGLEARALFPFFKGSAQAYLDSAATAQKPARVIERLAAFLSGENANIHRGAYALSANATADYENTRTALARFIGAPSKDCIVFTRGATEAINLAAASFGETLPEGSTIVLTLLEHHSNIVPWQLLAKRKRIKLEFAAVLPSGELDVEDFKHKVRAAKPALCAVTQLSNVTGAEVALKEVIAAAHGAGAKILIDAAQGVPHLALNVRELGTDFLAFSAHKMYGPTAVGCLYGKKELLENMQPVQGGGGMIETVATSGSTWAASPQRFEAGTQAIAEVIAWQEAISFIEAVGIDAIAKYERELIDYAYEKLSLEKDVTVHGPKTAGRPQASILSFTMKGVHPHDLATVADAHGVQIRAGHHCAMPLMKALGVQSTARLSVGVYSIREDIDKLIEALRQAKKMFA